MARFVAKRLLQLVPVLLGVTLLVFVLLRLAPGDAAYQQLAALGLDPAPGLLESMREELGLNAPVWQQYFTWLGQVLRLDFGASILTGRPVMEEIAAHFSATVAIALPALAAMLLVALPLGCLSAMYQGGLLDKTTRALSILASSVPAFCTGLLLILVFSVQLRWLPSFGAGSAAHIVLPAATLALGMAAVYTRFVRTTLLEQFSQGYIRAARARGIAPLRMVLADAAKNAVGPIITQLGISLGLLLSGSAVVEKVFSWPGLGKYFVDAVMRRDYPVVLGCVLVFGVLFALLNLCSDLACALLDPRVRRAHSRKRQVKP